MQTARDPRHEHRSAGTAAEPAAHSPPAQLRGDPRSRRRGRRSHGLPWLTAGAVPTVVLGADVLLLAEGGTLIESDLVFVVITLVALAAASFLLTLLAFLLFVLIDRERTERLVMIIAAVVARRKRRHRRPRRRPPEG